jgi:hypothetical protein
MSPTSATFEGDVHLHRPAADVVDARDGRKRVRNDPLISIGHEYSV